MVDEGVTVPRVIATDPFGLVGQVLDSQFRVDKFVGEGGFSAVYRGHHLGLNEPIAIKALKLPSTLEESLIPSFVQRFRDESRILYRLSQGNLHIVRSIAAGATHAPASNALLPYMVLEWLEGRSLQSNFNVRRTAGKTGRSLDEVLTLFEPAADGLAYAHTQGVVHRDINPGNLFLAETQQGVKMKVLDFGVAKLMRDGALDMGPRHQTVGQIRIFAPAYGAPEQFDDRIGTVGAHSDVYSFALILLEALRDKPLHEGDSIADFARAACDPNVRPTPRTLGLNVPDEVEAVFARATMLDPPMRWATAGDFWKSLKIAAQLATERKHESAARETPPLAMGTAGGTLVQTLPLGSTMPSPRAAPRPRTPTTIGIPPPKVATTVGSQDATRTSPLDTHVDDEEDAAESTTVHPPMPEVLRTLALREAMARDRGGLTPLGPDAQADVRKAPAAPPSGGTLMLTPHAHAPRPMPEPSLEEDHPAEADDATLAMASPFRPNFELAKTEFPDQARGARPVEGTGERWTPTEGFTTVHLQATLPHPSDVVDPTMALSATPARSEGPTEQQTYAPQGQHHQYPQQPYPQPHYPAPQFAAQPPFGAQPPFAPQPFYPAQPHPPTQFGQTASEPPHAQHPPAESPKKRLPLAAIIVGIALVVILGSALAFLALQMRQDRGETTPTARPTSVALSVAPNTPAPRPESTPPPAEATAQPAPPAVDPGEPETTEPASVASAKADPTGPAAPAAAPAERERSPGSTITSPAAKPPVAPSPAASVSPAASTTKPAIDPNAFNESAARTRLSQANGVLAFCKREGGIAGPGNASVTFGPDGNVSGVVLAAPYAGTKEGDCVASQFRRVKVPPFTGAPQTVRFPFEVPR